MNPITSSTIRTRRFLSLVLAALWGGNAAIGCSRDDSMGSDEVKDASGPKVTSSTGGSGSGGSGGSADGGATSGCDPFALAHKPIALSEILGIGQDAAGVIYVMDQLDSSQRLFVSSGGALVRQRIAGSGSESEPDGSKSYEVSVTDHDPNLVVQVDIDSAGNTRMGVLTGPFTGKSIVIGQQGEELALLTAADIAAMPVHNLPGEVYLEYSASLPDAEVLVVTRPRDDWSYSDFRLFLGPLTAVTERAVISTTRMQDGGSTTIVFNSGESSAVAKFPVVYADGGFVHGQATLEMNGTTTPLTLSTTQPAGATYICMAQ